jgi:flagellar basal-body rod protein FlgB
VDFTNIPLFNMMQQKMKYHASRQAVLAQNVANVDTPGYHARELQMPDFNAALTSHMSAKSMAKTNPMHMGPDGGSKSGFSKIKNRENTYELNPIGNNVVIEEEMMRVAENQSEYQKVLGIYRKSLDMFRIALGKGNGA